MAASGKLTVTDASNLFDDLITFLTGTPATAGQDWVIVKDWRSEGTPENKIVLKNSGLPGSYDVYIGFHDVSIDGNRHVLFVKTYKYWEDTYDFYDLNFGSLEGKGDTVCCVPHWNTTMDYWVYSNQKRVILVLKTQNRYGMCYLGSALSYLPSNEYIQPLICAADGYTHKTSYGYLDDYDSMFFTSSYAVNEQNYRQAFPWLDPHVSGYYSTTMYDYHRCNCILDQGGIWTPYFHTSPMNTMQEETDGLKTIGDSGYRSHMGDPTVYFPSGDPTVLIPMYITLLNAPATSYRCLVGEWDGVFWCPNTQLTAESTIDSVYTVFPNIDRSTWSSWIAIKEE